MFYSVISDAQQDPIQDLQISLNSTFFLVNKYVPFMVTVKRGSHVKYDVVMSDGSKISETNPNNFHSGTQCVLLMRSKAWEYRQ